MIFTPNTTPSGTFTIDLPPEVKIQYPSKSVLINGVVVFSNLPYVYTPKAGVSEIKLILSNMNVTYNEVRCHLYDPNLYCDIVAYLNKLSYKDRINSKIPYLYYLLNDSFNNESSSCNCLCDGLQYMYNEIRDTIKSCDCC